MSSSEFRIGIGNDRHRLVPGGPLRLGGIDIPHESHLSGHSDADALLHAVTDALLGAIGGGDIGELFPDTAPENRLRDSADFLRAAFERVRRCGYEVVNVDCIVMAERPKLSPFKRPMAERIAELLEIPADRVNVKAKTGEGIDGVGTMQVIDTQAVALVRPAAEPPGARGAAAP